MAASTISVAQAAGEKHGNPIAGITHRVVQFFEWFGDLAIFCGRVGRAALSPPWEFREFIRQCDFAGSRSLPLVAMAGAATGVVMALQMQASLVEFGARSLLPAVVIFSIVRETGPVITGLVVSGRVGAGIGAELGSMKVTEQIDAMEASAVDPFNIWRRLAWPPAF